MKKKLEDEVYTVDEVATMLKIRTETVLRYIKAKKIIAIKIGRTWRIERTDLQKFMDKYKNNKEE